HCAFLHAHKGKQPPFASRSHSRRHLAAISDFPDTWRLLHPRLGAVESLTNVTSPWGARATQSVAVDVAERPARILSAILNSRGSSRTGVASGNKCDNYAQDDVVPKYRSGHDAERKGRDDHPDSDDYVGPAPA